MHSLVVDDSRAIRALLGRMLRQLGFTVLEAAHGQEAIERLRAEPGIALALVDWNMPVMNGLEFVRAVRADQRFDAVNLVMVTTESELAQVEKALAAGANEYVMKPFTLEILLGKLALLGIAPGRAS